MLDYTKSALVIERPDKWLERLQLNPEMRVCEGEIKEYNASFGEMQICAKPSGYVELSGSIHKYFTGGSNATDFNAKNIALCLRELGEALQIDINSARLLNLEFGVNQQLPVAAKVLLRRAVLFGNNDFSGRRTFGGKGCQLEAEHQRYTFKAYDKAAQLQIREHLLRAEVRVTKMVHLASVKLVTLADLARPNSLAPLGGFLMKAWDNVLFCDPTIKLTGLPKPRRDLLTNGQSAAYWASLKSANSRKQRAQFREWTALYSADQLPATVRGELAATWARLQAGEA